LANTRLSMVRRLPSSSLIGNGRKREKDRTTVTISRHDPFPPSSRSTATTGVRPTPM
jgi:hypothetical protein